MISEKNFKEVEPGVFLERKHRASCFVEIGSERYKNLLCFKNRTISLDFLKERRAWTPTEEEDLIEVYAFGPNKKFSADMIDYFLNREPGESYEILLPIGIAPLLLRTRNFLYGISPIMNSDLDEKWEKAKETNDVDAFHNITGCACPRFVPDCWGKEESKFRCCKCETLYFYPIGKDGDFLRYLTEVQGWKHYWEDKEHLRGALMCKECAEAEKEEKKKEMTIKQ